MPSDFQLTKALLLEESLIKSDLISSGYPDPDVPIYLSLGLHKTSEFDNEETLRNVLSHFNLSEDLISEISSEIFKEIDVRH